MTKKRQRRSAEFKFRVALDAVKEQKTLSQLASEHEVHPGQITQWKKQLLDGGSGIFGQQHVRELPEQTAREAELFEPIGRLQMELAWRKKTVTLSTDAKRALLDPDHPDLSLRQQCALLGLNRASYYYTPVPEDPLNLELMRKIDEQYLKTPF